jgi:hypothetical protein
LDGKSGTGHGHSYLADLTGSPFTELSDTPANYTGSGGYTVKVKTDLSGLEFVNESASVTAFTGLSDTPGDYTGGVGSHAVKVNAGATGLEYVDDPYFVSGFLPSKPAVSAISLVHVFAVATSFPSGLTGLPLAQQPRLSWHRPPHSQSEIKCKSSHPAHKTLRCQMLPSH